MQYRKNQFCPGLRRHLVHLLVSVGLLLAAQVAAQAVMVQLDYSYDTNNFFSAGSDERNLLETAAALYGDLIVDDLDAIEPTRAYVPFPFPGSLDPGDSWRATFKNPSDTTQTLNEDFLTVPADTIIVFVGGDDFTGGQLAEAGYGGNAIIASQEFVDLVETRGETGSSSNEFAPWGGYVSVDNVGTNWDLSLDGSTLDAGESHLFSALLHEIGHIFGLGTAPSWDNRLSGSSFTGTEASGVYGSAVPTEGGSNHHFLDGIASTIYGTSTDQEPSLSTSLTGGEVKLLTELDIAALDDIGWDIAAPVPEPSTTSLIVLVMGTISLRRRRSTVAHRDFGKSVAGD